MTSDTRGIRHAKLDGRQAQSTSSSCPRRVCWPSRLPPNCILAPPPPSSPLCSRLPFLCLIRSTSSSPILLSHRRRYIARTPTDPSWVPADPPRHVSSPSLMAVQACSRKPLSSFDPFDPYASTNVHSRIESHNYYHDNHASIAFPEAIFNAPSSSSSARSPDTPRTSLLLLICAFNTEDHHSAEAHASNGIPHRALPASQEFTSTSHTVVNSQQLGDSHAPDTAFSDSLTPPALPPKSPIQDRPKSVKSVSILAPTDISPARRVFSQSVSDSGHSYYTSTTFAALSPEGVPALPTPFNTRLSPPRVTLAATSSHSRGPPNPHPSSMEPVTRKASSVHTSRNRLHKTRPRPSSPSLSPNSSVFSLLLSRAFGSGDPLSRHHRAKSASSMSDRSYRPTRSLSDGHSKAPLSRPSPGSRGSTRTDSSYTASSSASTSLSYASTSLTTPDSTSSPGLSPRNSTRTNKLRKKRPAVAPSAYPFPPGAHVGALSRSKSTPNGVGQRSPRNRIWSSVEEARHAAEEADGPDGQEPTLWSSSVSFAFLLRVCPGSDSRYATPLYHHLPIHLPARMRPSSLRTPLDSTTRSPLPNGPPWGRSLKFARDAPRRRYQTWPVPVSARLPSRRRLLKSH